MLGLNNIYHLDALEGLKLLDDNSVDLVISSPVYAKMKKYQNSDGIEPDKYVEWFIPIVKEIERVIKPTGSFILNINDCVVDKFRHPYVYDLISEIHKQTDMKMFERLFWNKLKSLPNRSRFGDRVEYLFWFTKTKDFKFNLDEMRIPYNESSINRMKNTLKKRFSRTEGDSDIEKKEWSPNPLGALPNTLINISSETKKILDNHVAVYPEELVKYFIKGATDKGDLVVDMFMGSGTTGLVSSKLDRNWIGFDISEDYINGALKRIKNSN